MSDQLLHPIPEANRKIICLCNTSNRHYQWQTFYQPEVKKQANSQWKKLQKWYRTCSFANECFFYLKMKTFISVKE
jgi:hypothetical protein